MKLTHWTVLLVGLALVSLTGRVSAHDLRAGETVSGQVAGAGASEVLDIDLAAGDEIKITLSAKGGSGCAPAIDVLDPHGSTVASGADERKIKLTVVAAETGTHQIRLVTDHASAPRFALKVRGDARRSYADASGALEIGAVAGSTITVKVKAAGDAVAEMMDSSGDDVALSIAGSGRKIRARTDALASTDDYTLEFGPAGATAKVRVDAPKSRGALQLTMTPGAGGNGSYTPPVAQGDDGNDGSDPADDGSDQGDGATDDGASSNDGTVADGTVGGGVANGIVNPAPAAQTDHIYLTVLLSERSDAELDRVRVEMARHAGESAVSAAARLAEKVADPIAVEIVQAMAVCAEATVDAAGIDAMVDLVAHQRRADRARAALNILAMDAPATSLGADPVFQAGQAAAEAELASLNAAIAGALEGGLVVAVLGGQDGVEEDGEVGAEFDAPAAPGAANEMIAGMAALDAAILSGPAMARARALDGAAIEMADLLYATYDAMLSANPMADPNAGQTRAVIAVTRTELETLRRQVFGVALELAVVEMPQVSANEAYSLDVVAFGPADPSAIDYEVEGAEDAVIEAMGNGIQIQSPGHAEARDYIVRARSAGAERVLNIRVEVEPAPLAEVDLSARVVDAEGLALSGARYEIRTSAEGEIALNAAGRPCDGETDAEGFFLAERVHEGEYVLVIIAPGLGERMLPLSVAAGEGFEPQDLGLIIIDAE